MKKYILIGALLTVLGTLTGAAFLGNADPLSRSCTTNYIRKAANMCVASVSPGAATTLTADNTCRNLDVTTLSPAMPATASMATLHFLIQIHSNNGILQRTANLQTFQDAACATIVYAQQTWAIREFAAVAGAATLLGVDVIQEIPLVSGKMYYIANDGGSTSTPTINVQPAMYFD